MNLQVKFSLIFLVVFGVQLAVAGYVCDGFLADRSARDQVIRQARLMMESSLATRTYTEEQIKPLVHRNDPAFRPDCPGVCRRRALQLLPQRIPGIRGPKEATLNPTNPRDRAVDWEADIVNFFHNNPDKKDFSGERDTPIGHFAVLGTAIKAVAPCLVCHSTPEAAPPNVVKVYGSTNGFGWKETRSLAPKSLAFPWHCPSAWPMPLTGS